MDTTGLEAELDVAIVGGGLAGLAAAAYLARSGFSALVLDRAGHLGGRAATHVQDGFHFNQGPHALYRGGAGHAVLTELGVRFSGASPNVEGFGWSGGALHALPTSPRSLFSTSLLGARGKLEIAKLMATVGRGGFDASKLAGVPFATWLDEHMKDPRARAFAEALTRLATYTNGPEVLSAGVALAQIGTAAKSGVLYLDDGWQSLVDGLADVAKAAGARVRTGANATGIAARAGGFEIALERGARVAARAVLIAASPDVAIRLTRTAGSEARSATAVSRPVFAACLDVALRSLPEPNVKFVLGIDQPLYFSVHTSVARLAPQGGALIHVAKYPPVDAPAAKTDDRAELEDFLDRLQPGWRDALVDQRFLRRMVVQNTVVSAASGGLAGRPDVTIADLPGAFIAGDWVGPSGSLADGSLASARQAAHAISAHLRDAGVRAA